jgi:uncharacterized protein (DUF2267 family)
MNYDQFMSLVEHRARLDTEEEAYKVVGATLSTLAERLTPDEARQLAAQLPKEIQHFLTDVNRRKTFGLDEFYEKVAQRESYDDPEIIDHARAVISVVAETVSSGEMEDVLAQLPSEYLPLFTFGSGSEYRLL